MARDEQDSHPREQRRGFAAMPAELRKAIASRGGKSHSSEHLAKIGAAGGRQRTRAVPAADGPRPEVPPSAALLEAALLEAARQLQAAREEYALTRVSNRMYQRALRQLTPGSEEKSSSPWLLSRRALAELDCPGARSDPAAAPLSTPAPRRTPPAWPAEDAALSARLAYFFERNGVVRRSLPRSNGHKGEEVRLVALGQAELEEIRGLLAQAEFILAAPFRKRKRFVQPLYGKQTARFLELVASAGLSKVSARTIVRP